MEVQSTTVPYLTEKISQQHATAEEFRQITAPANRIDSYKQDKEIRLEHNQRRARSLLAIDIGSRAGCKKLIRAAIRQEQKHGIVMTANLAKNLQIAIKNTQPFWLTPTKKQTTMGGWGSLSPKALFIITLLSSTNLRIYAQPNPSSVKAYKEIGAKDPECEAFFGEITEKRLEYAQKYKNRENRFDKKIFHKKYSEKSCKTVDTMTQYINKNYKNTTTVDLIEMLTKLRKNITRKHNVPLFVDTIRTKKNEYFGWGETYKSIITAHFNKNHPKTFEKIALSEKSKLIITREYMLCPEALGYCGKQLNPKQKIGTIKVKLTDGSKKMEGTVIILVPYKNPYKNQKEMNIHRCHLIKNDKLPCPKEILEKNIPKKVASLDDLSAGSDIMKTVLDITLNQVLTAEENNAFYDALAKYIYYLNIPFHTENSYGSGGNNMAIVKAICNFKEKTVPSYILKTLQEPPDLACLILTLDDFISAFRKSNPSLYINKDEL